MVSVFNRILKNLKLITKIQGKFVNFFLYSGVVQYILINIVVEPEAQGPGILKFRLRVSLSSE